MIYINSNTSNDHNHSNIITVIINSHNNSNITPSPPSKSFDFRGFDSSLILI